MLSLFPSILFLAPLSALLIRLALAGVLGYAAMNHFKKTDSIVLAFAIGEAVLAMLLVAGAWTQLAALGALLIIGAHFFFPRFRTTALGTALLSVVLALSLLVTGPGPFAVDWPL